MLGVHLKYIGVYTKKKKKKLKVTSTKNIRELMETLYKTAKLDELNETR